MYIKIYDKKYPCYCYPSKMMIYRGLPDDFPTPVLDEIALCADDGFVLRTDNPLDYLRQRFENGVLILTNEPEQPQDEPEEPQERQPTLDERVTAVEEAVEILLNGETEPPEEETEPPEEEVSDGQS